MTKRISLQLCLFIAINVSCHAQAVQTIKGVIVDKQSEIPLPGVNVVIEGTSPLMGTITNEAGFYSIDGVPFGKYTVKASYIGYETTLHQNTLVGAGKQVELNFSLTENSTLLNEVTIRPGRSATSETVNSMSIISGRRFSVEETRRYAGGMDDPARMVSAFAGVSTGNIQDNAIVVRGNNPKYVGWYLEGVEIPNPNHFSSINVIGGGFVTIFSNQLLTNSDFFTGAFPAEYGNVLSGVFDMRLRSGNKDKREYTFQAGVMGIDFAAEGPFIKGKDASYLVNYRYSTMSLVSPLIPSAQVPQYQDLSFKLNFPSKKMGTFSLWGIGAIDYNAQPESRDSTEWTEDFDRFLYDFTQNTAAAGISHRKIFGTSTFVNSTFVLSANRFVMDLKRLDEQLVSRDNWYGNNMEGKMTFKSFVNHKFSEAHTNRTGIILNDLFYQLENRAAIENTLPVTTLSDESGHTRRLEAFSQSQLKLAPNTLLNVGLHATWFELNDELLAEPRLGISQDINSRHKLSLGYGKHSSLEPLRVYFYKDPGEEPYPNRTLGLTKAHHLIAGYDWAINKNLRLKVEPYYQYLYDVPVISDSAFSMINFEQDFHFNDPLVNEGKGSNLGIDFTLEKYFDGSAYYLVTASLFRSQYETSTGEVYPTRYDKGYVINILAGKELVFQRDNRHTLRFNGRFTIAGGNKMTPIDRDRSLQSRAVYYDWTRPYATQNPTVYFFDASVSWRKDYQKVAGIFTLEVKNLLGNPSGYNGNYNYRTKEIEKQSVVVVMPNISYRIEF